MNRIDYVANTIEKYSITVLLPIGISLNLITLLISFRKKLNQSNLGFFVKSTSITNILFMMFMMLTSSYVVGYEISVRSAAGCKLIIYFRRIFRELTPCVESLFTIDRFLMVAYPRRFKTFMDYKNTKMWLIILGGLLPFYLVANMSSLFYTLHYKQSTDQVTTNQNGLPGFNYDFPIQNETTLSLVCDASELTRFINDLTIILLRSLIPLTLMLTLNMIIHHKLVASTTRSHSTTSNTASRDKHFTRTLFKINVAFIACYLPEACGYLAVLVSSIVKTSGLAVSWTNLAFQLTRNLALMYNVSFLFINLKFNKIFRAECRSLTYLCLKKIGLSTNRISSTNIISSNQSPSP